MRRLAGIAGVAAFSRRIRARSRSHAAQTPPGRARRRSARRAAARQSTRSGRAAGRLLPRVPSRDARTRSIDEILDGLEDPYTDYLTPEEYEDLQRRTAASYSGVGLTVGPSKGGLVVKDAQAGPAREAGINRGDRIVSIDGHGVRRLPFDRSLELLKGKEGTSVSSRAPAARGGAPLHRRALRHRAAGGPLAARDDGTDARVRPGALVPRQPTAAIETRVAQARRRGAEGVVLDLRGNPGGLLSQAVGTVSLFLEEGVVCVTEGVHHGGASVRGDGTARRSPTSRSSSSSTSAARARPRSSRPRSTITTAPFVGGRPSGRRPSSRFARSRTATR